jgi:protein-tyrosine-phosphatase
LGKEIEVLFVCGANINRSQIAAAIFNKLSKRGHAISAGTEVGVVKNGNDGTLVKSSIINNPVALMGGKGYDLSKARIRKLTPDMLESADKVILLRPKKKLGGILPSDLRGAREVEWWDIDSISDETPYDEYSILEKKRIEKIRSLVKDLVRRVG